MRTYNTILFDLFFTLVEPKYLKENNEFDVLNISAEKWEQHAEHNDLYLKRIKGNVINAKTIIEDILIDLDIIYDDNLIKNVLAAREKRFYKTLTEVDSSIIKVLKQLKKTNKQLVLVSNADIIDVKGWTDSPLKSLFDDVFFSYEIGLIKPNIEYYKYVLDQLKCQSDDCLFVGDGGDNELFGAYQAKLDTVQAAYFYDRKNLDHQEEITYKINTFEELLKIV